jgi:hypothetical protein
MAPISKPMKLPWESRCTMVGKKSPGLPLGIQPSGWTGDLRFSAGPGAGSSQAFPGQLRRPTTYADFHGWVIPTIAGWFVMTGDSKEAGPRVAAIISIVENCRLRLPLRDYLSSCSRGRPIFRAIASLNSRPNLGRLASNRRNPARSLNLCLSVVYGTSPAEGSFAQINLRAGPPAFQKITWPTECTPKSSNTTSKPNGLVLALRSCILEWQETHEFSRKSAIRYVSVTPAMAACEPEILFRRSGEVQLS